jgi:hypothetical protein
MAKKPKLIRHWVRAFGGSMMDGPDVDVVAWAGVQLTEEEEDRLWSEHSVTDLLEECGGVYVATEEGPDVPLYSDTFFTVFAPSAESLREELAAVILNTVRPGA